MSLNISGCAKRLENEYTPYSNSAPYNTNRRFLDFLQNVLDEEFQKATESLDNFKINPPAGSLYINLYNDRKRICKEIGRACSEYWIKAIGLGSPMSCDRIDSVVNDASKIASPIENQLCELARKYELSTPYYYRFVEIIFNNVKTIKWTITESDSDCGTTFNGNIS